MGGLSSVLLSPLIEAQYKAAVTLFVTSISLIFGGLAEEFPAVDKQLQYDLELLWQEGESKSLAARTVCGLQHVLDVRRVFPGSRRLYAAWDCAELPLRATPLPGFAALGIAGFLLTAGEAGAAALVAVGFACFLRTGDLRRVLR